MTLKMDAFPSLKIPAAKYAAISMIFKPECMCLGAKRQTVELKLSFALWPPKHLSNKSSFDKSS